MYNPNNITSGQWTGQAGYMGYHEICVNLKTNGWTKVEGSDCTVGPHAYKGNQWVGFDDLETVKTKVIESAERVID